MLQASGSITAMSTVSLAFDKSFLNLFISAAKGTVASPPSTTLTLHNARKRSLKADGTGSL